MPDWPSVVSRITSAGGSTFVRTIAGLATSLIPEAVTTEVGGGSGVVAAVDVAAGGGTAGGSDVACGAEAVCGAEADVTANVVLRVGAVFGAETIVETPAVVCAEAARWAAPSVDFQPVAGAEFVVDSVTVRGAEALAVFAGRKPKALTGAEVSLSFPPSVAVTFPALDKVPAPATVCLAGPACLPHRPAIAAVPAAALAETFPLAGSSWFAPGKPAPGQEMPWALNAACVLPNPTRQNSPSRL